MTPDTDPSDEMDEGEQEQTRTLGLFDRLLEPWDYVLLDEQKALPVSALERLVEHNVPSDHLIVLSEACASFATFGNPLLGAPKHNQGTNKSYLPTNWKSRRAEVEASWPMRRVFMEWLKEHWVDSTDAYQALRTEHSNNLWQKEVQETQTTSPEVAVTLRLFDKYLDPFEYVLGLSTWHGMPMRVRNNLIWSGAPSAHLVTLEMACAALSSFWSPMFGAEAETDSEDGDRPHAYLPKDWKARRAALEKSWPMRRVLMGFVAERLVQGPTRGSLHGVYQQAPVETGPCPTPPRSPWHRTGGAF